MIEIRELIRPHFCDPCYEKFVFSVPRLVVAYSVNRETEFYEVFVDPEGRYRTWREAIECTAVALDNAEVYTMHLYTRQWKKEPIELEQLDNLPVT